MKIEVGASAAQLAMDSIQTGRAVRTSTNQDVSAAQSTDSDKVSLRSNAIQVDALVKQAMSLPDVRTQKVDAVRASMNEGSFRIDTGKIASAMIAENTR